MVTKWKYKFFINQYLQNPKNKKETSNSLKSFHGKIKFSTWPDHLSWMFEWQHNFQSGALSKRLCVEKSVNYQATRRLDEIICNWRLSISVPGYLIIFGWKKIFVKNKNHNKSEHQNTSYCNLHQNVSKFNWNYKHWYLLKINLDPGNIFTKKTKLFCGRKENLCEAKSLQSVN